MGEIFANAKKHNIPGPTNYKSEKSYDALTLKNFKRFQFNKEKRSSIIDDVFAREKNMKGPADYKNTKKHKILGNYKLNERKGAFLDEVEFSSNQTPGCNHYKVKDTLLSNKTRSPNAMLNRDHSSRHPLFIRKDSKDLPSPD